MLQLANKGHSKCPLSIKKMLNELLQTNTFKTNE